MDPIARTPAPPYFAVIFTSIRTAGENGYGEMAAQMFQLATKQPGFLGVETARDSSCGITVSYWESVDAIRNWKQNLDHQVAQTKGKQLWYEAYQLRVCKVERAYGMGMEPAKT